METAELSVRVNRIGPPLASQVTLTPPAANPIGRAAILVLVHGYNNSYWDAKNAYAKFLQSLKTVGLSPPSLPIYEFYWPGDEVSPIWSALSFAEKIGVAKDAAAVLCNFVENLRGPGGGPIDIHFVAHSLGNRLLLELMRSAARFPAAIIRSVTLMAAAVPEEMVAYNNDLYRACLVPRFSQVLHSRGDCVLFWAFPPGETARGEGFLPTAVGRYGNPSGNWQRSQAFDSFGHGAYWIRPGPPALVLDRLSIATPRSTPSSSITGRATAEYSTATRAAGS
jgi:hypothetical protein